MNDANLFIEKRRDPRVDIKIPVKYSSSGNNSVSLNPPEKQKEEQSAQTLNLSLGGMYLVTEKRMDVGSVLYLDITLPDHPKHLSASAQVLWAFEKGGGLRFLTMKAEDAEALKGFLEKFSPSQV